ncbi:hypothetical protein EJB05_12455 [Eragrostis curvula]|uniref:Uncharacterized protein n=1 Tax=Eragrostis curvula TaxID=38414 RepID=A0A5J9VS95_9POAL|nr:hypothetical protein EJB05_12455 [Eragrostis curvula]
MLNQMSEQAFGDTHITNNITCFLPGRVIHISQVVEPEVTAFLLSTEIIPLCLCDIEMSESFQQRLTWKVN